jgi:hypothetical protein
VLQEKIGELKMDELIDPALVVISNKAREFGMDLLNNAKNSMVDNFRSIKWIYHELEELKLKMSNADTQNSFKDQGEQVNHEDSLQLINQRLKHLEEANQDMLRVLQAINENMSSMNAILKDKAKEEEGDHKEVSRPSKVDDDKE